MLLSYRGAYTAFESLTIWLAFSQNDANISVSRLPSLLSRGLNLKIILHLTPISEGAIITTGNEK
ncbi:hypothetical protein DIKCMJMK_00715 [Shewanella oneidensis]|nr:hypothetical protein [Shewanella oneidensis]